jgi:hypothetical protein
MRTGYRLALGAAVITIVVAAGLAVVELFKSTRDPNADGQVSVPGRQSVTLPQGDVIIFYGDSPAGARTALPLPNITLRVRTASGQSLLGSTPFFSDQFEGGGRVWRSMAKLRVPEPGSYEAVAGNRVHGADDPVLGFGHTGSRDMGYVLFVLFGGFLLTAILGLGTALMAQLERD